jgi:cysteine dioxygenase
MLQLGTCKIPNAMSQDVLQSTDNNFASLILHISKLLGPGGIDSDDIDPSDILDLMRQYTSKESDWTHFVRTWEKPGEPYVRNLVDSGNGKYNLLLLVWNKGSGSCIHDHTKHCCMKILKGQLKETLYEWPDQNRIKCGEPSPPAAKKEALLNENEVSYISSKCMSISLSISSNGLCRLEGAALPFR